MLIRVCANLRVHFPTFESVQKRQPEWTMKHSVQGIILLSPVPIFYITDPKHKTRYSENGVRYDPPTGSEIRICEIHSQCTIMSPTIKKPYLRTLRA